MLDGGGAVGSSGFSPRPLLDSRRPGLAILQTEWVKFKSCDVHDDNDVRDDNLDRMEIDMATLSKGRIGIYKYKESDDFHPVPLSDDGASYKIFTEWPEARVAEADGAVIDHDKWKSSVDDGVWLCGTGTGARGMFVIEGGNAYLFSGSAPWIDAAPIERIGDIPDGWRGDDE